MSDTAHAKCSCRACGRHLEFPVQMAGVTIQCPSCQQSTDLYLPEPMESTITPGPAPAWTEPQMSNGLLTMAEIASAFTGRVRPTPTSLFYQLGLCVVSLTMVVLPVLYLAMIALAAYGVCYWATHFAFLLGGRGGYRFQLIKLVLYGAPLFAGIVVVFFMVKPLLARRAPSAKPLALNPENEPVLFDFIAKICATIGAPFPKRVDLACHMNASAGFNRGLVSFLGNDLVLTIGLPLVAATNTRQFAGVLAHEFGHFTQGFGMRLTYIIRSVNAWFARVVYERDAWDVALDEWCNESEDGRLMLVANIARLAVWISRLSLMLLMFIGHGIGCFMLRQMEYDADSYEIKLAGSQTFEDTMRRFHVLSDVTETAYKTMRVGWNNNRMLPDNFPAWLMRHDHELKPEKRTQLEDSMGLEPTGFFHTHPSNGDRIRYARRAAEPGVFTLEAPAQCLFENFDVVSRQVTALHYEDDLGIPLMAAKLMPIESLRGPIEKSVAAESVVETTQPAISTSAPGERPRVRIRVKE